MPKVQPPELKKFMDKKLSRKFRSMRAEVLLHCLLVQRLFCLWLLLLLLTWLLALLDCCSDPERQQACDWNVTWF